MLDDAPAATSVYGTLRARGFIASSRGLEYRASSLPRGGISHRSVAEPAGNLAGYRGSGSCLRTKARANRAGADQMPSTRTARGSLGRSMQPTTSSSSPKVSADATASEPTRATHLPGPFGWVPEPLEFLVGRGLASHGADLRLAAVVEDAPGPADPNMVRETGQGLGSQASGGAEAFLAEQRQDLVDHGVGIALEEGRRHRAWMRLPVASRDHGEPSSDHGGLPREDGALHGLHHHRDRPFDVDLPRAGADLRRLCRLRRV